MPRVKRGTKRRARRKKILERASGYFLTKSKLYRRRPAGPSSAVSCFAYSGRKQKKRQFPLPLDRPHRRRHPPAWPQLQPVHQRPEARRHGSRSQDPGGSRRKRLGRLRALGRASQDSERHQESGEEAAFRSEVRTPRKQPEEKHDARVPHPNFLAHFCEKLGWETYTADFGWSWQQEAAAWHVSFPNEWIVIPTGADASQSEASA